MMTTEERKAYMAGWRKAHPNYGRELRAWRRVEHAKIKEAWIAKARLQQRRVEKSPFSHHS